MLGRLDALVGGDHRAQAFLLLDEFRVLQRGLDGLVQLLEHVSRCALGGVHAVPDGHVEVLQARLASVGRSSSAGVVEAFGGGHSVGLDLLAFDLAGGVGGLVAQQVDLAADQVSNGGAVPL